MKEKLPSMFQAAIITFREFLEIALILTIVLAATRGVPGRGKWIGIGLAAGAAGSVLVAMFTEAISNAMEGVGQEIFNGSILLTAALAIGWTVIWMQKHGREMAMRIKRLGQEIGSGEKPLAAIAVVIGLASLREGAEIALFLYALLSAGEISPVAVMTGGIGGAAAGMLVGALIYLGLLRIPVRHFFRVTGWLLILLACGISAQAAGFFVAAGLLPEFGSQAWDTSHILAQDHFLGAVLHALVGYTAQPSGMQVVFYGITLAVLAMAVRVVNKPVPVKARTA